MYTRTHVLDDQAVTLRRGGKLGPENGGSGARGPFSQRTFAGDNDGTLSIIMYLFLAPFTKPSPYCAL